MRKLLFPALVISILFIPITMASTAWADEIAKAFPYLSKHEYYGNHFYYQKNKTRIFKAKQSYDPVEIMSTRLDQSGEKFIVVFDPGPSDDPMFSFYRAKDKSKMVLMIDLLNEETDYDAIGGINLVMPGNGSIYISGNANQMFNKRLKLRLSGNKFVEVEQPFYYVGVDTVTTKPIKLYATKKLEKAVVSLPKGYKVRVLANQDNDYYLVKTGFGLVGWLKIPYGTMMPETPLKDIWFYGD